MKYVLPAGIGDTLWAMLKIESVATERPIDFVLGTQPQYDVNHRAVPFLKRFSFTGTVSVEDISIYEPGERTNAEGRYRYVGDMRQGDLQFLIPNRVLERGDRIETWLPEHTTNWDVMNAFDWSGTEIGWQHAQMMKPFVAFYFGPEDGQGRYGHNRGPIWKPEDWSNLAALFHDRGMSICLIGASWDRPYWEKHVKPLLARELIFCVDLIGKLEIGQTLALLKESKFFVGYQSGLSVASHYLGKNVVTWWRKDGDSCHPDFKACFDNRMKDAWTRSSWQDRYMGLLYGDETPEQIMDEIDRRRWIEK